MLPGRNIYVVARSLLLRDGGVGQDLSDGVLLVVLPFSPVEKKYEPVKEVKLMFNLSSQLKVGIINKTCC